MDLASWFGIAILLAALAIIPLSAWAVSGSWHRAWDALRQYLKIMASFLIIGGGVGLLMVAGEFMNR